MASGAMAMEYKTGIVGLPSLPVPQGGIPSPEVPLYRKTEQTGIVKLLIFIHEKGRFVASARFYAKSDRDESFFLWYRFQQQDNVREDWEEADAECLKRPPPPAQP